jgi:dTDP-4-amino-4,6-dideoxygalactose transaminase
VTKPAINSTFTPAPPGHAPVPLLDLGRQYSSIREEVLAAIERVCASQHFVLGAEGAAFEREMSEFCGAQDAIACASGTDALWLALVAIGVQPGDAVLTTGFSFFASASAIVRAGARPVFIDIEPSSFNLDPRRVEAFLRNNTAYKVRAILPVHLYGQCADMTAFERIAAEFNLAIVEDAAQGIGAEWNGRRAGSLGLAAAFSFYPTKNLSAYGDAGLMTTRDPETAAHMRRLRNHGSRQRYLHEEFGWNSRLDEIQAAILRVKLPHVMRWNEQRRERATNYDRLIRTAGLAGHKDQLEPSETAPVVLPPSGPGAHHVFHQYVIRAERRDALRQHLAEHSIATEIYYPIPLHLQPCLAYLGYREGDLPQSERASQQVLALPIFPELSEDEQRRVVASIAEFYS